VAVLPFKNLSSDAGQAFFSDGITEDVITALGRFSNLLVVAKSRAFNSGTGTCRPPRPAACSTRAICSQAASGAPVITCASLSS
jgi:TolB-like protein